MVDWATEQPLLSPVGEYLPCQGGTFSPDRGNTREARKGVIYITYNTGLTEYARENRTNPTRVEWLFWHLVLKKKWLLWYKFRRQKIISSFILDFYCSKLLLWIELDGWYHKNTIDYDTYRDSEIYKKWILVIRFKNEDIEKNLSWVISKLENIIKNRVNILLKNYPL